MLRHAGIHVGGAVRYAQSSVSSTLAGLMSRCMMPAEWRYLRPFSSCKVVQSQSAHACPRLQDKATRSCMPRVLHVPHA